MDGGRDRGFGASPGPAKKIMVPYRPAGNAMAAFSAAMTGASSMRGWSPEPATSWTMKGPYGRWTRSGFRSLARPRQKNNGPIQVGRKCDGRIFGRDGWRIVDAGMVAGTCHKLDDERSLWTVEVIGVLEPREDRPKK